ncbi:RasGEF domain containing protein [Histomonas meleagridis]|uniref:RasGEF domain containing protein n=1 Tax=Histomonas meleagridis TaxID=135588 RepID=UPI00355AA89D|nr:RasGEF domain containing protein [Histomonas meleagridis]KAH0801659.1 RasGEF domain containing protein [Histomonas meleagridis]
MSGKVSLSRSYNPIKQQLNTRKNGSVVDSSVLTTKKETDPKLQKAPLPISHEFDLLCAQHRSEENVDRSDWLQRVLDKHQNIRELRECVNPVVRAATFARLYLPSTRLISHEMLLALISQHFRTLGLSEAQASLHSEWGSDFNIPPHKLYSQLALLIQRGVHRAERFWELSMPSVHACATEKLTQQALDEEISRTIGAAPNINEDDQSLLNETPGDPNFIKYDENGEPVEASLNQIIYYVTTNLVKKDEGSSETSKYNNTSMSELTSALCLTISSYASAKVFFKKIRDRFEMLLADDTQKTNQLLCVKLFKEWIHGAINDIEPQVLDAAMQFTEEHLMSRFPSYCRNIFEGRSDNTTQRQKDFESKAKPVELGNCTGIWTGDFTLFDLPVKELARQLTVWSSNKYYAIKRCELLDCAWDKPRLKYRAPNVIALTEHYNRFSRWIEYSILSEKKLQDRIYRMEWFISLAQELFDLNNFYDAMCVLSSFEANSIYRLREHRKLLSPQSQERLQDLQTKMDINGNFVSLRNLYNKCLTSSTPALPYIGVLLSDLFKYYEGTQEYVNKLINIRKFKGVYKMIAKIEEFMRDKYCIYAIDQVQAEIDKFEEQDEDVLYEMSNDVEKEGAKGKEDLKDE